jgi:thymidylate synthase
MDSSYRFDSINRALPFLCSEVMEQGELRSSRNGDTMEMTHVGVTLVDPRSRYITHPDRKASLPAQIAETMWVLAGRNDIGWLKNYLPRAADFSDDGHTWRAAYGRRLRNWETEDGAVDQLDYVINLLRKDPDTRQAVMTIYDPQIDSEPGLDTPCNGPLQFLCRDGVLSLHVFVRSNDLMWGWSGINAFEWSSLLEIVAGLLGLQTGSLHFSITSLHIYEAHWARARKIAAAPVPPVLVPAPRFRLAPGQDLGSFDALASLWFLTEEKLRHGHDASDEIDAFPEPMLQSWLRVIAWYWSGDRGHLEPLSGTDIHAAALAGVGPKLPAPVEKSTPINGTADFLNYVNNLHESKHRAYGDSWKRRGEMLGIMANVARKIDRLGQTTDDETAADTAIDLMVYLAKTRWWLSDTIGAQWPCGGPFNVGEGDEVARVAALLWERQEAMAPADEAAIEALEADLTLQFEHLEQLVVDGDPERVFWVQSMLNGAVRLAYTRWAREQWFKGNATRAWAGYGA